MACLYKQKLKEEGGSGDRAVSEELSAGERRGRNSPQPHLLLPPETHGFLPLFSFGKQVVSGQEVVIPLPPWISSSVFLAVPHRKVKLASSQTLQYNIWYRV